MLSRLDLVLLFALLYDMAVKPDVGDASSWLWGLAGVAIAEGFILWRYRAAVAQGPPAAAADTAT